MGAIFLIIFIGILLFIVLGLLGWGIQLLGLIGGFLGNGIMGCIGCFVRFFWLIFVAFVLIVLVCSIL